LWNKNAPGNLKYVQYKYTINEKIIIACYKGKKISPAKAFYPLRTGLYDSGLQLKP